MKPRARALEIVVDRKAALMLIAVVVLVGGAGLLSSQQLTMTATYPIPAGVYNQLVTTGNSGTAPADTTLNRNAGNTILVPTTNAAGNVGIGTASPAPFAKLDVNTSGNHAINTMDSAYGGLVVGYAGPTIQARDASGGLNANLILQQWGGAVGVGTSSPASMLSVNGGIQLGDDTSTCTPGKAGTLRWHSGQVQVCQSNEWSRAGGNAPRSWRFMFMPEAWWTPKYVNDTDHDIGLLIHNECVGWECGGSQWLIVDSYALPAAFANPTFYLEIPPGSSYQMYRPGYWWELR